MLSDHLLMKFDGTGVVMKTIEPSDSLSSWEHGGYIWPSCRLHRSTRLIILEINDSTFPQSASSNTIGPCPLPRWYSSRLNGSDIRRFAVVAGLRNRNSLLIQVEDGICRPQ
jgi:hypothetical protein